MGCSKLLSLSVLLQLQHAREHAAKEGTLRSVGVTLAGILLHDVNAESVFLAPECVSGLRHVCMF